MRERERLISRIRQLRRAAPAESRSTGAAQTDQDQLQALEGRVQHLEQMVQGLQDSVHRESSRQAKLITELDARTQPAAIGRALSDDARERGL